MIEVVVKRKGNLDTIAKKLAERAQQGVENALQATQARAQQIARQLLGSGALDEFITVTQDKAEGRITNTHAEAMFIEFGTGTYAELPHIGKTFWFKKSGFAFWYVPKILDPDPQLQNLIDADPQFYLAYATPARPIMRTTAIHRRYENAEEIRKELRKLILENGI